jgi:hypothetical protein
MLNYIFPIFFKHLVTLPTATRQTILTAVHRQLRRQFIDSKLEFTRHFEMFFLSDGLFSGVCNGCSSHCVHSGKRHLPD